MRCAWDAAKSDANLRERGFDFAFASTVFDAPILVFEDTRRDYGERRFACVGLASGRLLTVVFTDRLGLDDEPERRIISARQCNRRERERYEQAIPKSQGS